MFIYSAEVAQIWLLVFLKIFNSTSEFSDNSETLICFTLTGDGLIFLPAFGGMIS